MQRPWVQPAEVKEYSESAKVAARKSNSSYCKGICRK